MPEPEKPPPLISQGLPHSAWCRWHRGPLKRRDRTEGGGLICPYCDTAKGAADTTITKGSTT